MKVVFKVLTLTEWEAADAKGVFLGSTADLRDGFIHLSTADQTEETVARHFSSAGELILLALDAADLGQALRWEPSRGGALFPHLYKPLSASAILWSKPFDSRQPDGLRKLLSG